jgi:nitrate reductase NapAB chaperone NapD
MVLAPSSCRMELDARESGTFLRAQPSVAICSYLVIPEEGAAPALAAQLAAVPGCEVVRAENREVLILVTDTPGPEDEASLRVVLEGLPGIRALILTFGELEPGDS